MTPIKFMFLTILFMCTITVSAQDGVSINNDGSAPHGSAILDVSAEDKGFLPPRLNSEQRDDISNPAEGLVIFNTDTECINYFNGTTWKEVCPE